MKKEKWSALHFSSLRLKTIYVPASTLRSIFLKLTQPRTPHVASVVRDTLKTECGMFTQKSFEIFLLNM